MKLQFEDVAGPLARLIGHSIAAAIAFCALAGVCLIPIAVLKLLSYLGISELDVPLRVLAEILLFADISLFGVIFLSSMAVFAARTIAIARKHVREALEETSHDRNA